jgi:glucose-1-phosphate adenylyltransferase
MASMNDILGVILGGGRGQRLYPLTRDRAKPAVPIGGKYRLIDIPISNCINSGINRIEVLTMFNSVSLNRHIARAYVMDPFHRGWVEVLAAEQTPDNETWYQGTADAVRKQMDEIRTTGAEYTLILAGDHLYRMDYRHMAEFHWGTDADITIAVQPVPADQATRLGLLYRGADKRITNFVEKPKDPKILAQFVSTDDPALPYLGSMGIYMFKTEVLLDILKQSTDDDFGGEVIPKAIHSHNVFGYDFKGYWLDIGTMRTFYEANLSLTRPNPPFSFHDPVRPVYTRARFLPGSIFDGAVLENALITEGCRIGKAEIRDSLIGLRSQIGDNVTMKCTVMMGADYYDSPDKPPLGGIPVGIGDGCQIDGAIIDKNVRMGPGVIIRPFPGGTEITHDDWAVRDGIIVIPKHTILPGGTVISP